MREVSTKKNIKITVVEHSATPVAGWVFGLLGFTALLGLLSFAVLVADGLRQAVLYRSLEQDILSNANIISTQDERLQKMAFRAPQQLAKLADVQRLVREGNLVRAKRWLDDSLFTDERLKAELIANLERLNTEKQQKEEFSRQLRELESQVARETAVAPPAGTEISAPEPQPDAAAVQLQGKSKQAAEAGARIEQLHASVDQGIKNLALSSLEPKINRTTRAAYRFFSHLAAKAGWDVPRLPGK